jgi:aminoglycoside N3'-acetyltransferase
MIVTRQEIQQALRALGVSGQAVCLHSSLRSFGHVVGGAEAVVRAFMDEGCTVLVPTFSSVFEVAPPPHLQFERNGWDYGVTRPPARSSERVYSPEALDIDRDMGAIPAAVIGWANHVRGNHPLDSFTAVGPRAFDLIAGQAPSDVYAPLAALARMGGSVLLMGVGLERMTLLHLAEKQAGRRLFRRWANDTRGQPAAVEVGGCSEGFGKFEPYLRPVMRRTNVGPSRWTLLPASQSLARAAAAIRADAQLTHCGVETCERCNDAVRGGPILSAGQV